MENERQKPPLLWIVAAIAGGLAIGSSLLLFLLTFVIPQMHTAPLPVILIGVSLVVLFLGIGLMWAGLTGLKRLPPPKFYTRWGGFSFLFLTLGLILVAAFIPGDWQNRALFAPIHLGVAVFPAFFLLSILTWIAGQERTLSLRELIAAASGGGSGRRARAATPA